jgi:hypothetical protein
MDFDKLQKDVARLEELAGKIPVGAPPTLKEFASGLREILVAFLKDRREQIRPGQIFRDAAAKNIVPGDIAPRGDSLLVRWGGHVTPTDPQTIKDDAARFAAVADKVLPVLKAYKKEK